MSISADTPYYVIATKRDDGLIDYVVMNPRGWVRDEVKHVAPCAARDEEQARGRIQNIIPPWQESIEFRYVDAQAFKRLATPPGDG